jgi:hypothetical protein
MIVSYPLTVSDNCSCALKRGTVSPSAIRGRADTMLSKRLHDAGLRAWHMQCLSLGSVALCVVLWIRAKTVDQDERGNAERRALFVGLWPPTIWLIGDSLEREE